MNKYLATVIMGVVRLLATIAACIALRRCGRRPLTMISGTLLSEKVDKKFSWLLLKRQNVVLNKILPQS